MSNSTRLQEIYTALKTISGVTTYMFPLNTKDILLPAFELALLDTHGSTQFVIGSQETKIKVGIIVYVQVADDATDAVKLTAYKTTLDYIDTVLSTTDINTDEIIPVKTGKIKDGRDVYAATIIGTY